MCTGKRTLFGEEYWRTTFRCCLTLCLILLAGAVWGQHNQGPVEMGEGEKFWVRSQGKWGLVNESGEFLLPAVYKKFEAITTNFKKVPSWGSEGSTRRLGYLLTQGDGKRIFMSLEGAFPFPANENVLDVSSWRSNRVISRTGEGTTIYDTSGTVLSQVPFIDAKLMGGNTLLVSTLDIEQPIPGIKCFLADLNGKAKSATDFKSLAPWREGYFVAARESKGSLRYGVVNAAGKEVIAIVYHHPPEGKYLFRDTLWMQGDDGIDLYGPDLKQLPGKGDEVRVTITEVHTDSCIWLYSSANGTKPLQVDELYLGRDAESGPKYKVVAYESSVRGGVKTRLYGSGSQRRDSFVVKVNGRYGMINSQLQFLVPAVCESSKLVYYYGFIDPSTKIFETLPVPGKIEYANDSAWLQIIYGDGLSDTTWFDLERNRLVSVQALQDVDSNGGDQADKVGGYDIAGKLSSLYGGGCEFDTTLLRIEDNNLKMGWAKAGGEIIKKPQFIEVNPLCGGYIQTYLLNMAGSMDQGPIQVWYPDGKLALEGSFHEVRATPGGILTGTTRASNFINEWRFLNVEGKLSEMVFEEIIPF